MITLALFLFSRKNDLKRNSECLAKLTQLKKKVGTLGGQRGYIQTFIYGDIFGNREGVPPEFGTNKVSQTEAF